LRFDYRADRFLTNEEIDDIVETINEQIVADYDVVVEEMSFDDAKKL
jgi:alanyl-tRNA synthetase